MSGTHALCYAGDLVPTRRTSEIGDQSSGVKDPIGDNSQQRTNSWEWFLGEGRRYTVVASFHLFRFFSRLMLTTYRRGNSTNKYHNTLSINNLILIEMLSIGAFIVRLYITRKEKRREKGCKSVYYCTWGRRRLRVRCYVGMDTAESRRAPHSSHPLILRERVEGIDFSFGLLDAACLAYPHIRFLLFCFFPSYLAVRHFFAVS